VAEATFHNGPVSRFEATYTDIVGRVRIVNTYDMWLDGVHMSTSVASFEFEPIDEGTRLTHVEHDVFFDQFWADGPNREAGSRGILETLGNYLTQDTPAPRAPPTMRAQDGLPPPARGPAPRIDAAGTAHPRNRQGRPVAVHTRRRSSGAHRRRTLPTRRGRSVGAGRHVACT
jgi:hypothetical protein